MKSALVLGAGLQGICTAYFLSKHGLDVTLIERNEGPHSKQVWAMAVICRLSSLKYGTRRV